MYIYNITRENLDRLKKDKNLVCKKSQENYDICTLNGFYIISVCIDEASTLTYENIIEIIQLEYKTGILHKIKYEIIHESDKSFLL